jgi:uncharacterized BrkB/YihY/UPF0761 family membrane protein/uncharacterized membrane protein YbhN (UPF0104 family)
LWRRVDAVRRRVDSVRRRVDSVQRRHTVLGFPYAVMRKHSDDGGGRLAALLTYYGFLSLFPLLLLTVAILAEVLRAHPALRHDLVDQLVPPYLRSDVEQAFHRLPPSGIPLLLGALGLLWSGIGAGHAGSAALNRIWAIPHRKRPDLPRRYGRVLLMVLVTIAGAIAAAGLAAASSSYLHPDWVQRLGGATGTFTVTAFVLLLAHKLLTARPRPVREIWDGAALAAIALTVVLDLGASILPGLIARSGPVYGSFATVVGVFSLMYIASQALVFSGEISAVRAFRLFPRGIGEGDATPADIKALTLLAREQERLPGERISATFDSTDEGVGEEINRNPAKHGAKPPRVPKEPKEPKDPKDPNRAARRLVIAEAALTMVLLYLLFGVAIPKFASYGDIWAAVKQLTTSQFLLLLAMVLLVETLKAMAAAVLIGPLTLRWSCLAHATATMVSNTVPGPSGTAMRRTTYRRYGLGPADFSLPLIVHGLWSGAIPLLLPGFAIALLAFQDSVPSRVLWLSLIAIFVTLSGLGLVVVIMRREQTAYRVGAIVNRPVNWGRARMRRQGSVDVGRRIVHVRAGGFDVVRRCWGRLTVVIVARELTTFMILLVALRAAGAGRIMLTPVEIFAVYAVVRLATLVDFTPGGIGVAEALYISGLLWASQGTAEDAIVAAVFIYRMFTYLGPIVIGVVCWPVLARHLGRTSGPPS